MALLDGIRALFASPRLQAAAEPSPVVPSKPVGISGGGNFSGRLMATEPNALLREQAGYGRAGTYDVGEWAQAALTNPYVTMALDFIAAPVGDARIDIEVDEETPLGKQQADFLRWALTERFRLSTHLATAARGFLLFGFALFEPRAELVPCPVLGRDAFALAALEQRLPNSLSPNAWREDAEGRLVAIQQQGPRGGEGRWEVVELPAARALLYSWKRQGGNWAGESQFRSVWYIAQRIMPMLGNLIGVTAQREGAGTPIASALDPAAEATPDQRRDIMTFLANLNGHENQGGVLPNGWKVEWVTSPGANKGHLLELYKGFGQMVLQQTGSQQMVLGVDGTGSRSVGEVHDARSMAMVRSVLSFAEGVINGDSGEAHGGLVRRLLEWNGLLGVDGVVPRVKLTPKRPELAPKELADALAVAKNAGLLTVTLEDENVLRERAGLPPITEEQRAEAKERAAAIAPPMPGVPVETEGDDAEGGEDGEEEEAPSSENEVPEGEGEALKASAPRPGKPWVPWRPLRASEKKVDFAAMDRFLASRPDVFEREVRPVVVEMLARAASAITAAMADGKVMPEEVAAFPLDTKRLDAVLASFVGEVREEGKRSVRREVRDDAAEQLLQDRRDGVLTAAADEEGEEDERDDEVTQEADDVVEAEQSSLRRRIVTRLRNEVEREAIDTARTGGDASQVVSRVMQSQLDTGAFRSDAAYVTTKVFNVGREEAARIMGGIASVEYSAILDSGTCGPCRAMDGRTAAFESPEHDAMVPPNRDCDGGDRCRCVLVMIPGGGDA